MFDALFRGDLQQHAEYYEKATGGAAWMSTDEVRARENLNPTPGGDVLRQPLNTAPATTRGATRADRAALIVREAATRLVREEIAAATKGAERRADDGAGWQAWLRTFYEDRAGLVAFSLH